MSGSESSLKGAAATLSSILDLCINSIESNGVPRLIHAVLNATYVEMGCSYRRVAAEVERILHHPKLRLLVESISSAQLELLQHLRARLDASLRLAHHLASGAARTRMLEAAALAVIQAHASRWASARRQLAGETLKQVLMPQTLEPALWSAAPASPYSAERVASEGLMLKLDFYGAAVVIVNLDTTELWDKVPPDKFNMVGRSPAPSLAALVA